MPDKRLHSQCYAHTGEVHYVKVSFGDMWINGITVRPSIHHPERGPWVQMPSFQQGSKYKRYIEFPKGSKAQELIEQAAVEATNHDHILTDKELKDINWDDVDF